MLSSASFGHSPASVGTVDTTVMSRRISHGPKSWPERTSARGAGTRHAPWPQASHISSQDASKATDRPASTRSSGPSGLSWQNRRASASTNAAAERCVTATPFGLPVEPEVKMIQQSWSGVTSPNGAGCAGLSTRRPSSVQIASTSASPKTVSARSSGSSASTGTYAQPARIVDRIAR